MQIQMQTGMPPGIPILPVGQVNPGILNLPILKIASSEQTQNANNLPEPSWQLYPKFIEMGNLVMADLFSEVNKYLAKGVGSRYSCVLTDQPNSSYGGIPHVPWSTSPTLCQIRMRIFEKFRVIVDYVLVHLYKSGESGINWHFDSEALNTPIFSLSLGATRKFRFRRIELTSGWDYEYFLESGDLVEMKVGCQRQWKHCVPVEKTVKEVRMNCTFRLYE